VSITTASHHSAVDLRSHQAFIEVLEQLYRERALIPFAAGRAIPLKVDEVLVICRGIIQLFTIQQDGSETLLGLAGPSMPVGMPQHSITLTA
jgi:hypothetical protein